MERLTEHHVNKKMGVYMICSGACDDFNCTGCEKFNEIVDRLAAYEDTGLEPEEITTEPYGCVFYCNRKCNLDGDFCAEGPGCPHEINAETAKHLLELARAEKDGRLMVLPPNDPLTLEELREMDGEPVWVEIPTNRVSEWCIAKFDPLMNRIRLWCSGGGWFDSRNVGKSLFAYRRKPEEETC